MHNIQHTYFRICLVALVTIHTTVQASWISYVQQAIYNYFNKPSKKALVISTSAAVGFFCTSVMLYQDLCAKRQANQTLIDNLKQCTNTIKRLAAENDTRIQALKEQIQNSTAIN
jgi:hypothetical protein